jgi:hypothetical protein
MVGHTSLEEQVDRDFSGAYRLGAQEVYNG